MVPEIQTHRQTDRQTGEYSREVCGGAVVPEIHVFEAVNHQQWQVVDCFTDVMKRMGELKTVSRQCRHHV